MRFFTKINTKRAAILIAFIITLVYADSLVNKFVWDDNVVIVNNNFIKSWKNFPLIFSKSYLSPFVKRGCCYFVDYHASSGETSYRPLTTTSYFIDYSIWKLNPFGYHLTNLSLHIINAILLYLLLNLITQSRNMALLASLLFALHPANSEAVSVISNRKDLLAFLFYLSSFLLYIKLDTRDKIKKFYFFVFSLISFLFALFSKENAVTLPLVLILYDRLFAPKQGNNFFARFKPRYIGYFAVLAFYIWVRFLLIVNASEPAVEYPGGSFYSNILTMARVSATYIKWILFPVNIPAIIPNQHYLASYFLLDPWVIPSIILVIVCCIAAVGLCKISKEIRFGALWCFVAFLPVSNIIPIPNYIASRYLYLPLAGFCFFVSAILARKDIPGLFSFSANTAQRATRYIIIAVLAAYSILSVIKNTSWKNNTVFLLEMEKRYPDNALVHLDLGDCFRDSGLKDKAINEYETAIRLNPGLVDAYNNLGVFLGQMGRLEEAAEYFRQAIKADPKYAKSYNNLGVTYAIMKKYDKAGKAWRTALQIEAGNKEAQDNLQMLKQSGY